MLRAFAFASAALLASAVQAQVRWEMPTPYPDGNFHTKNIVQFTQDVSKASGGRLAIKPHTNGSMIKHPEIKRAVQTGQVPIGEILVSTLANENAIFAFDSNPFLANGYGKQRNLWSVARPYIEKRLDAQGMVLLYSVPWPPQGIYAKKELQSIADLKGAKFRTYNPTTSRMAELMGALPITTIQVPEIPQAFHTGQIDSMITSSASGVDAQAWDFLTHFHDTQAFLPQNVVFVNKGAWAKLDSATQRAVSDAAKAAEERGWMTSEAENARYVKILADKGIRIVKPSAKLAGEFVEIGKKLAAEWAQKAGPDGDSILKAYAAK